MNAIQRVTRNLSEKLKHTKLYDQNDNDILYSYDNNKENKRTNTIKLKHEEKKKIKTKTVISSTANKKTEEDVVISTVYYSLIQSFPKKTKQIKEYQKKLKTIISSSVVSLSKKKKEQEEVPLICVDLSRNRMEFTFLYDFFEFLLFSSTTRDKLFGTLSSVMCVCTSSSSGAIVNNLLKSKVNFEELFFQEFIDFLKENQKVKSLAAVTNQNKEILLEIIERIIYSTFRLYCCLHKHHGFSPNGGFPLSSTSLFHHTYHPPRPSPHIIWENILIVKGFRPSTVAQQDYDILSSLYLQYSSFSYAIAEHQDDSLQEPQKNRNMLTLDDSTLCNTPLINEIVYSLQLYLRGISEKSANHSIEGLAFLYSLKDGYEQKPHLDFNYSLEDELADQEDNKDNNGSKNKGKKRSNIFTFVICSFFFYSVSSFFCQVPLRHTLPWCL
jgi:hypothetical protein